MCENHKHLTSGGGTNTYRGIYRQRGLVTESAWSPDYAFRMTYYILLYVTDIFENV